jgi:prepilin-type N-terminal cleavage/methylation domain-containing protein/prepilin-type processing-associated H-X9-DG protein
MPLSLNLAGRRLRSGFTLIELLVVIAIIAILIALLVPAIQKVREAAARSQCQNNLKQIGLAMHQFHDANGNFPPGEAAANDKSFGWGTYILPFIEQQDIYDKVSAEYTLFIDPRGARDPSPTTIAGAPNYATKVQPLLAQLIPTYLCSLEIAPFNHPKSGVGKTSYAGCLGTSNDGGSGLSDGVIRRQRHFRTAMAEITDGTSNTILVGELRSYDDINRLNFGSNDRYFPTWCGTIALDDDWDAHLRVGGDGSYNAGGTGGGLPKPINNLSPTLQDDRGQCFGSLHAGGANFVLCDGSVRFIFDDINLTVLQCLCSRLDGRVFSMP